MTLAGHGLGPRLEQETLARGPRPVPREQGAAGQVSEESRGARASICAADAPEVRRDVGGGSLFLFSSLYLSTVRMVLQKVEQ